MDDDEARAELRFRAELEFLQCLASPLYCQFLAQHDYLETPKFLDYLRAADRSTWALWNIPALLRVPGFTERMAKSSART